MGELSLVNEAVLLVQESLKSALEVEQNIDGNNVEVISHITKNECDSTAITGAIKDSAIGKANRGVKVRVVLLTVALERGFRGNRREDGNEEKVVQTTDETEVKNADEEKYISDEETSGEEQNVEDDEKSKRLQGRRSENETKISHKMVYDAKTKSLRELRKTAEELCRSLSVDELQELEVSTQHKHTKKQRNSCTCSVF